MRIVCDVQLYHPPAFQKRTLTITLESQHELGVVGSLFARHLAVPEYLQRIDSLTAFNVAEADLNSFMLQVHRALMTS